MKQPYSRRTSSRKIREEAAEIGYRRDHLLHVNNGEEATYRNSNNELNYIANYSKGLDHFPNGEVIPTSYRTMLRAIDSGEPDDFERITLGAGPPPRRKLVNPQAGLAFDLEGPDAHAPTIRPAPRIDGLEAAGEMVELYWMALLRDVPFVNFAGDADIGTAAGELSGLSDFRGPKLGGIVTPDTIFRGSTPGDLTGPYLSQFLLKGNSDAVVRSRESPPGTTLAETDGLIKYGSIFIDQKQKTVKGRPDLPANPNSADYLTDYSTWRLVQNGFDTSGTDQFNTTRLFIHNMRDLANYVHFDALYEAYLNACIYLLSLQVPAVSPPASQTQILFDQGNPYRDSRTQEGFGTFGAPHILSLVTEAATRALKAVWFQKWFVHRRLRPEEFGGLIHKEKVNSDEIAAGRMPPFPRYSFISGEVLGSQAITRTNTRYNSYLLPQAFPEGCPTHPSYGAGHATVAGACVTILKAWFDESFELRDPVTGQPIIWQPNANGTDLIPYPVPPPPAPPVILTVGGELNKLASNIAIGRNMGGVHYRSDYIESIKLGEAIAIGILEEQKLTYNENYSFRLTTFDGNAIIV